MPAGKKLRTEENMEKFVNMVLMGVSRNNIMDEIGIKESTYYAWLDDDRVIGKLEKYRSELKTEGMNYIKGRYKKYLKNIDKLANNFDDKRVAMSANQFMVEKMDGKNVAMIEEKVQETITVEFLDDEE